MYRKFIFYTVFLIAGVILFSSCKTSKLSKSGATTILYPAPPDTARLQFLTSFSSSKAFQNQSKFSKLIVGEKVSLPIIKPFGIEIGNNKIYICDLELEGLEIINLKKNSFEYFKPTGKGTLKKPLNCFVDKNSFLYIADGERKQVVIFDNNLNYVNAFGLGSEYKPTDVNVFDNKIWVTDIKNNKVDVFEQAKPNKLLFSFSGGEDGEEGRLYQPTNIYITDKKVYVTDFGEFKIKTYDHKGNYLSSLGSYGRNLGQFVRPKGIAVDKEENLFVVDTGFENTQIFNEKGQLLMFFGGNTGGPGGMYLPAGITIDYNHIEYFTKYVDADYTLKYLVFVTSQYGKDKIGVYGAIMQKK